MHHTQAKARNAPTQVRALLVRLLLVRLFIDLAIEDRTMTRREQRLYTLDVKALARYSRQSVEDVIRGLLDDVRRGFIRIRLNDD